MATHWAEPGYLITFRDTSDDGDGLIHQTEVPCAIAALDEPCFTLISVVKVPMDYNSLLHCAARCGWRETR